MGKTNGFAFETNQVLLELFLSQNLNAQRKSDKQKEIIYKLAVK